METPLHSLRSKFIVLAVLLICITQFGTLITTSIMAESDAARQAQANLSIGEALFNELMRGHTKALNKLVTTLADTISAQTSPMLTDDYKSWLSGESATIGADFSLLLENDGAVITTSDDTVSGPYPTLVALASKEGIARSTITKGDRVFEMITVSVPNMRPKMWLSTGFEVNASLINMLQARTGLDVTIIGRINDQPQVIASSVDSHVISNSDIDPIITGLDAAAAKKAEIRGERFLIQAHSFMPNSHNIVVLLKAPLNQAIAPYHALQLMALVIGVLAFIIALIGATQLFRGIRAPFERIQAAARRISAGDYSVPVNTRSNEEFSALAMAINNMQSQVAERESRVLHETRFDQLTGLQNRFLTVQSLEQSIEKLRLMDSAISVLIISLTGFSEIRASFGQEIGDKLLLCAAEKLHSTAPPDTALARLEGDEFMFAMEATDATSAMVIAENIVSMLAAGLSSDAINISVSACIGISTFPQDGDTAEKLLLHATIASHEALKIPGHVATYQTGMEEQYTRRLEILSSLRRATREDEFKLYLQPKVNLVDGSICGAEALIRWDHPTLSFLSPLEFIPIAEQSGNIGLISQWVLTTAIRECRLWLEAGIDLPVSVNLSGHDLFNTNLPQMIAGILKEHDLAPNYLMLEITELALFHDFDQATVVLQNLRDLGMKISVDDFGTGHSSMARIRNLPVDEIKIDRSFVTELPDNSKDVAIVRATIELAHNLGIEVLAEGIESQEAMHWLAEMGCERVQGFLISRPMPAETFSLWVNHYSEDRTAYINVIEAINP
jgi:diguanylate cyclase (GGDEF)-like protein